MGRIDSAATRVKHDLLHAGGHAPAKKKNAPSFKVELNAKDSAVRALTARVAGGNGAAPQAATLDKPVPPKKKSFWDKALDFGKGIVDGAKSFGEGIAAKGKSFIDGARNFGQGIIDKGKSLVEKAKTFGQGIIDKGKSFIDGAKKFGSGLLDKAKNFGSKALDFGKKAFDEVKSRGLDIGRSALNIVTEGIGGFARSVAEGIGEIGGGIAKALNPSPLGKLFSGDFKGAWEDLKNNVAGGAKDILGGLVKGAVGAVVDTVVVGLQNGVSAVQTALGLEAPGRKLNEAEIAELRKVYGDSIDYSNIILKEGDIGLNNKLAPHTIGNTIYIPEGWLDPTNANYKAQRDQLLVHEAGHVWQYQNGGTDYIGQSIWNQLKGVLSGGDRGEAYKYDNAIKNGTPWPGLNPEQQAELMEKAYERGLFDNPAARFLLDDGTDATAYVRNAIEQMRKGQGAP